MNDHVFLSIKGENFTLSRNGFPAKRMREAPQSAYRPRSVAINMLIHYV